MTGLARRALGGIAVAAFAAGCGYKTVSYPTNRNQALGVAVMTLENDSFDPGYEYVVSDALRVEFARRGALRVVDEPELAQVLLRGRVSSVDTRRRSFSSVVLTLEYQLVVRLELELERPGTALALDRRVLSERDLYLASADIEVTRKNRDEALRRIASMLASRIHDVIYEVAPP